MAIELAYATPEYQVTMFRRAMRWLSRWTSWFGWFLLAWILVAGIASLMALAGGKIAIVFGSIIASALLIGWGRWRTIARERRANALLAYIHFAVRLNLPLPAMLEAAEAEETGRLRKQLSRMRTALLSGSDVASALHHVTPELPQRTADTLIAAEHTGTLAGALDRLRREQQRAVRSDAAGRSIQLGYVVVLIFAITAVMALVCVFVLPRLAQILADFKIPLPPVTQWLLAVEQSSEWLILIGTIAALFLCSRLIGATRAIFMRSAPKPISRFITDRVLWYLPIAHSVQRDAGLADVCDAVADALGNHRPVLEAITLANQPHINRVLLKRVETWHTLVEHGQPLGRAAAAAKLPRLMTGLLTSAETMQGTVPTLRFLSSYYRDRNERMITLLTAALMPAASLVFGAIVLFVTLAIFKPMLVMDELLMPGVRP